MWYVLPGIRSELAKELVGMGMSRKDVSERLGITRAAVSQYITDKRGNDVVFEAGVKKAIKNLAEDMMNDNAPGDLTVKICEICLLLKGEKSICEICDMIKGEKLVCK